MKSYLLAFSLFIATVNAYAQDYDGAPCKGGKECETKYYAICETTPKDTNRPKVCLEYFDSEKFAYIDELKNDCGHNPIVKNKRCPKGGIAFFCTDIQYNPDNLSGVPGVYNIDYYMYGPEKSGYQEILQKEKKKCLKRDQKEWKWTVKESGTNWRDKQ